jgi:hypothetical protein
MIQTILNLSMQAKACALLAAIFALLSLWGVAWYDSPGQRHEREMAIERQKAAEFRRKVMEYWEKEPVTLATSPSDQRNICVIGCEGEVPKDKGKAK